MKRPFQVNAQWLLYAHGPGAEDGQPLATRLCDLLDLPNSGKVILLSSPELVVEIIDVAELYTNGSNVQDDERLWFRSYPKNVIKRGKAWLRAEAA